LAALIKYDEVIKKVNFFLLLLLAFSIPFHRLFSTYVFIVWGITSLMEGHFVKRLSGKSNRGYLLLFILFYLLHIIGSFYSENSAAAKTDIILKLPFIIMPVFLFLSRDYLKEKSSKIMLSFVAGNLIASVICLVEAFYRSVYWMNGSWVFNAELMEHNYTFWQMLANGGNNFMYEPLSVFLHPGYFSVFIVTSALFIIDLLMRKEIGKTRLAKGLYIALIIFFSIMVYLLFARTALIALFMVFLIYLIYYILKSKKSLYKIVLVIAIVIGGVMVLGFNGRMRNSINELKGFFSDSDQHIDTENRLVIWYNSLDIIKDNLIAGVGTGDNKDKLIELYKERGFKKAEAARLNIHNQFLETAIQLGLMGLFALLAIFILPFIKAIRNRNILLISFLVVNGLFFLFESCLNRQAGVFYFVLILSVLIFVRPMDKKTISSAP
jgi:O-antigen ligase